MVLVYTVAILIDRSRELLTSLALATFIICLALSGSTADIGFQLSFASVFVVVLGMRRFAAAWRWRYANPLAPPRRRARANLVAEAAAGYIAVSFWALVGTAPLLAFHFNQFSFVGVIANAAVVPITGLGAVVCGLIAAMSFIWLPAAREVVWLAGQLVWLGTFLAGWFFELPCAWTRIFTASIFEVAIAYAFIMLWLVRPLKGEELMRA